MEIDKISLQNVYWRQEMASMHREMDDGELYLEHLLGVRQLFVILEGSAVKIYHWEGKI